jgi:hypothetical protein
MFVCEYKGKSVVSNDARWPYVYFTCDFTNWQLLKHFFGTAEKSDRSNELKEMRSNADGAWRWS